MGLRNAQLVDVEAAAGCLRAMLDEMASYGDYPVAHAGQAREWLARSVTGEGIAPAQERQAAAGYYAGKRGPLFACGADKLPCAWGAVKVMWRAAPRVSAPQLTPGCGHGRANWYLRPMRGRDAGRRREQTGAELASAVEGRSGAGASRLWRRHARVLCAP